MPTAPANRISATAVPQRMAVRRVPAPFRLHAEIDGQTLEITFRDVPGIAEAELLGVKRLIGAECFCTVSPQTRETVTVRFVVPLQRRPNAS